MVIFNSYVKLPEVRGIIPTAASVRLVKYDHLPRMVIYLMIYGHEINYESLINQQYM